MFKTRSTKLERIDTGDYTSDEYAVFLREIAFINKYLGDQRALKKTLLRDIAREWQKPERKGGLDHTDGFSVLDIGCGSGELLRYTAEFARQNNKKVNLVGIDLNEMSVSGTASESRGFPEISAIRGDAFHLPFADGAFDYAISSLFFHHLTDEQIPQALKEMSRVARRGVFVIDLHRHPVAYVLYKLFCTAFRISPLVRHDGSLSILKGFNPDELRALMKGSNLRSKRIERTAPFRIIVSATK